MLYTDYLEHYGVKGMEWGKKKKQTQKNVLSNVANSMVSTAANQFFKSTGLKSPLSKDISEMRSAAVTSTTKNLTAQAKNRLDSAVRSKKKREQISSGITKGALTPVAKESARKVSSTEKSARKKKEIVSGVRSGAVSAAGPVLENFKSTADSVKTKKSVVVGIRSGGIKAAADKTVVPVLKTVKSELGTIEKIRTAIGKANIASAPRNIVKAGQNAISKLFKRKTK